jgi:hypothetical protein
LCNQRDERECVLRNKLDKVVVLVFQNVWHNRQLCALVASLDLRVPTFYTPHDVLRGANAYKEPNTLDFCADTNASMRCHIDDERSAIPDNNSGAPRAICDCTLFFPL